MPYRSFPFRRLGKQTELSFLTPQPQQLKKRRGTVDLTGRSLYVDAPKDLADSARVLAGDLRTFLGKSIGRKKRASGFPIRLRVDSLDLPPEGYTLEVTDEGIEIVGVDGPGVYYGVQTLSQFVGFTCGVVPQLSIRDWPTYRVRSVMPDLGRSAWSVPLIKRTIRIMARLKLNHLHLHLYDDQLMGVRFKTMPLGKENPHAWPIGKLKEIVAFARKHHVSVCPELESWGHVGTVTYHYPELHGVGGMFGGSSFGIGPATFKLLEQMYDEVVPKLEKQAMVHLGMDEAKWAELPGVKPGTYSPKKLVGILYDTLRKVARRHRRDVKMVIWADHGGRRVPEEIADKIVVEPWNYWALHEKTIRKRVKQYGGRGKTEFIMGCGKAGLHVGGTFGASRIFARAGRKMPNCLGLNLCMWECNDLNRALITVFGGADAAWSPTRMLKQESIDPCGEYLSGVMHDRMISWQTLYRDDAGESHINRDRGEAMYMGYYLTGPKAGQPVAPTADRQRPSEDDGSTQ